MELVTQWINNNSRNYDVGVQLYCMHGTDAGLKRLFAAEAETPFKRQKLFKSMKALVDGTETILQKQAEQAKSENASAATQATFTKGWPKESNRDSIEMS